MTDHLPSVLVSEDPESCSPERTVIENFEREFERLHERSRTLIEVTPTEIIYAVSDADRDWESVVMSLLRSAGLVEQTSGGISSSLWDHPIEWTLPETLSTKSRLIEYLDEVEATRKHAFASFAEDRDLLKRIATPSGITVPLVSLLLDTLVRALEFHGRAEVLAKSSGNLASLSAHSS